MAGRAPQKQQQIPQQPKHVTPCDACGQRAEKKVGDRNLCETCIEHERIDASSEFCKARGLNTAAEMRAYCIKLARSFGRPSFENWCKNMTQRTIDLIVVSGGPSDQRCLERLRAAGVIDGRNKLIMIEGRDIAAAAYRAERARSICKDAEQGGEEGNPA